MLSWKTSLWETLKSQRELSWRPYLYTVYEGHLIKTSAITIAGLLKNKRVSALWWTMQQAMLPLTYLKYSLYLTFWTCNFLILFSWHTQNCWYQPCQCIGQAPVSLCSLITQQVKWPFQEFVLIGYLNHGKYELSGDGEEHREWKTISCVCTENIFRKRKATKKHKLGLLARADAGSREPPRAYGYLLKHENVFLG